MPYLNDDTALLFAFQNGKTPAENALFDRFYLPLCLYAERITRNTQQAEDIVVESFEKMMDRKQDFETLSKLKNFLYTTVHNASINEVLTSQRHRRIHEKIRYMEMQHQTQEDPTEREILRVELLQEIYREMENLPNRCGQIFKLLFVDQLSTQQVAEQLSIDPQSVRTAKARAIQLIRASLLKKNRLQTLLLFYALTGLYLHN